METLLITYEDGTPYDPPRNPLKEKYPPLPKPSARQICDGWSCQWCDRCPDGADWKVPEEDMEVWQAYQKELAEYNKQHGGVVDV